jgi:hypothetical protein
MSGTCSGVRYPTLEFHRCRRPIDRIDPAIERRRQLPLLVLDGAPNCGCGDLAAPGDVSLLFLPHYDPKEILRDLV